jgi:thiosulfate reductase cytochrome b subunit
MYLNVKAYRLTRFMLVILKKVDNGKQKRIQFLKRNYTSIIYWLLPIYQINLN